jgi:N-methylhydantoinase B
VLDCIEVISEEGTINNATFPAATSMSTVNACTATGNLIWEAMGRMYGCCEELRDEVIALGYGGVNLGVLSGQRQDGRRFVNLFSDSVGGGGAKAARDGVNTSGSLNSPSYGIPNVERIESLIPVLYMYRRERSETAGAGTRRGGVGLEFMMIPHGIESDMEAVFFATGVTHLIPKGINGGSAGSVQQNFVARRADIRERLAAGQIPQGLDEIGFDRLDLQEAKAATQISPHDAWINFCCGGGGYGDPLLREPENSARDVKVGLCTREEVERLYGVILRDDGTVDADATTGRRDTMRAARFTTGLSLGPRWQGSFAGRQLFRYAETLAVRETAAGAVLGCICCNEALCPAEEDPRQRALMIEAPLDALSALNGYQPSDVVHRAYACPSCATTFSSDVQLKSEDPRMPEMHLRGTRTVR